MTMNYVHGYSSRENVRLNDQASTLAELLHCDTVYPPGSTVLEAGCGVGGQTITLVKNSPGARFTCVDISRESLERAREKVSGNAAPNASPAPHETPGGGSATVDFLCADLLQLPFPPATFDHVFVCFVLEHLREPRQALELLLRVLKPGGTITAIEGDHGSVYFHPESAYARRTIQCLVDLQARVGGDSLIGRRLFPLLREAGCREVRVSPRMVYVDSSRPGLVEGFTRNTFTAMVEGVKDEAIRLGSMNEQDWARGIRDLYRTAEPDGTFCYTFFKAVGKR